MKKARLHLIAITLLMLSLLHSAWIWGGLAHDRELGSIVRDATTRELSFAGLYRPLGELLLATDALSRSAAADAADQFAHLRTRLLSNPDAAMQTLVEDMAPMVAASYYGTPLLLLISAVLWWRRPRSVHLIRRG